jgi:hypothetical protein
LLSTNNGNKIYRTITLPVVLYRCETWSLTLREECRLRVFGNRVLRRIFGANRDKIRGEWKRIHNKELYDLYLSPNIIWVIQSRIRWAGHLAWTGKGEMHTRFWWGNLKGCDHFEDLGIDERITLIWNFKKWHGKA